MPSPTNSLTKQGDQPTPESAPRGNSRSKADGAVQLGRGFDAGTANLLVAEELAGGEIRVRAERNAFLEIPAEFSANKAMLTRLGVPYASYRERFYVLGNPSFDLANMFGKEVRRPMCDGFLSPHEKDAIPMLRFILEELLGAPAQAGEAVHFSLPAPSIDRENDTVYHEGVIGGLIKKLGFTPHAINEAHAIVYSELEEQDFTGIAVSCGAGMFNVCVAYKSIPALTFSVSRGGDWIDEHVAKVMGLTHSRAAAIKESMEDLRSPKTREEEAVVLYYRSLIEYVLSNLKQRFELSADVPQFTQPVHVVVAGGTSLPGGFTEVFAEELEKVDFPLNVAGVRRAEDAFTSVVRGCLISARLADD